MGEEMKPKKNEKQNKEDEKYTYEGGWWVAEEQE
jgi:hypothetical protein